MAGGFNASRKQSTCGATRAEVHRSPQNARIEARAAGNPAGKAPGGVSRSLGGVFREHPRVEVAGIEPASFSPSTELLRAQPVKDLGPSSSTGRRWRAPVS